MDLDHAPRITSPDLAVRLHRCLTSLPWNLFGPEGARPGTAKTHPRIASHYHSLSTGGARLSPLQGGPFSPGGGLLSLGTSERWEARRGTSKNPPWIIHQPLPRLDYIINGGSFIRVPDALAKIHRLLWSFPPMIHEEVAGPCVKRKVRGP